MSIKYLLVCTVFPFRRSEPHWHFL